MEDKQKVLRKRILEIQNDPSVDPNEKRFLIQQLFTNTQLQSTHGKSDILDNIEEVKELEPNQFLESLEVSYYDENNNVYGCKHYKRKCMKVANCCNRPVPCRICHDEIHSHKIDRFQTKLVVCSVCKYVQAVGSHCVNCETIFASYFCKTCIFYNDATGIYHCDECGICRIGNPGETFHCKECQICYPKSSMNHKHVNGIVDSKCPVCRELVFTSRKSLHHPKCGHCIHVECLNECLQHGNFKCSLCNKSIVNMDESWTRMDNWISRHPMPHIFNETSVSILCNDCEVKGETKFHYLGMKCGDCGSYNTSTLSTKNMPSPEEIMEYDKQQRELEQEIQAEMDMQDSDINSENEEESENEDMQSQDSVDID